MSTQSSLNTMEKTKENLKVRKRYNCVYHNDNKTTFEFVAKSLSTVFGRTEEEAFMITYAIHSIGIGIANKKGLSKDIASTKQAEVLKLAKEEGFPLKVTIEEEI